MQVDDQLTANQKQNKEKLEEMQNYFQNEIKSQLEALDYNTAMLRLSKVEELIQLRKQENEEQARITEDVQQKLKHLEGKIEKLESKLNLQDAENLEEYIVKIVEQKIEETKNRKKNTSPNTTKQTKVGSTKETKKVELPKEDYNIVAFKEEPKKSSPIYQKINTVEIKEAASDILDEYNKQQEILRQTVNKLSQGQNKKEIKKNQILFGFEEET